MTRIILALLILLALCGSALAKEDRWHKLMSDEELSYYLDEKSVRTSRSGTVVFWMKLASRKKDYLRNEYRMPELEYILFNYEINCDKAIYKPRGVIYYDRNGKQLDKQVPPTIEGEDWEPIPPESMMEVAQQYVCSGGEEEEHPHQLRQKLPETAPAPAPEPAPAGEAPELPSLAPQLAPAR